VIVEPPLGWIQSALLLVLDAGPGARHLIRVALNFQRWSNIQVRRRKSAGL
jgi:hypothetical protein